MNTEYYTSVHTYGKYILVRGVNSEGKRFRRRVKNYHPSLFILDKTGEYSTVDGKNVRRITPGDMKQCKKYIEDHPNLPGAPLYGMRRFEYQYISDTYTDDHIHWLMDDISVMYLDIEVQSKGGYATPQDPWQEVVSISMKMNGSVFVLGLKDYVNNRDDVTYIQCDTEKELLTGFLVLMEQNYPDIITGWNIENFDIPYLIKRMIIVLGDEEAKKISPWNFMFSKTRLYMNKVQTSYTIYGIAQLDYMNLYRKFSAKGNSQESYALNYICSEELDEKKINYDEYGNLSTLYRENFQKFIDYNIHDVELVERLEKKLGLLELALTLAYDSKCNYEDVFMQVRMWTVLTYNKLKSVDKVIPLESSSTAIPYMGAYVKEPLVGNHEWLVSFDLTSLYPHLIMMYNISPDTIVHSKNYSDDVNEMLKQEINIEALLKKKPVITNVLKKENLTMTPNKQLFRRDIQGFLPQMMEEMFRDRKRYKDEMIRVSKELETGNLEPERRKQLEIEKTRYNNLQLTKKICLNSAYGALGNEFFMFFDVRQAEGITSAGQLSIRWVGEKVNTWLNDVLGTTDKDYIIASDTDSIYISLETFVEETIGKNANSSSIVDFIDSVCKTKIQKVINRSYDELAEYINAYDQKMNMKRELICDKGIWTAKKRYILNVWDSEGVRYKEPKIKISGLEAIKSSTPGACRKRIKEAIGIIMNKTEEELKEYVSQFKKEYKSLPLEDLAFPRSVSSIYKKRADNIGTPIHVAGAQTYNRVLKDTGLDTIYDVLHDGEKIKFIYLKEPNKFQSHVMAFSNFPPKEFELEKYVDYEEQFNRSFLAPLKIITSIIGWNPVKTNTLF